MHFCYMMTISCSARLSPHDREKHNKRWPSRRRADAKLPPALLPPRPPACPDMITNCLLRYQRRADETLAIKIPRSAMRTLTPAPRSSSFTPHPPLRSDSPFPRHGCVFPSHAGCLFGGEKIPVDKLHIQRHRHRHSKDTRRVHNKNNNKRTQNTSSPARERAAQCGFVFSVSEFLFRSLTLTISLQRDAQYTHTQHKAKTHKTNTTERERE